MSTLPGPVPGAKPKLSLPYLPADSLHSAILNRLPAWYQQQQHQHGGRPRARSKSKILPPGVDSITNLQTSFSVWDGVRQLQRRNYTTWDLQYVFLAALTLFSLWIMPPAPTVKFLALVGSVWILLMPATGQFFRPSMMIWIWLLYFFSSRFIPYDYRPHIWVRVLPALENVLYGANLSNILSAHKHPILDVLAWLPYGVIHFAAPLACSIAMFIFAAPGSAPVFAKTFGWMSILGVSIQLCFPCTPPWYENEHGLVPAEYGMPGSPAGLARLDAIFGFDMYTTNFTNAPLPFGAFPSLHAANAVLEALFMSHCFPQFRVGFSLYAAWVWWATMYLSHHYAVDLVGGGLIAAIFFYYARAHYMPRRQEGKLLRWEYEYVEFGHIDEVFDEERDATYFRDDSSQRRASSSDGWTLGSGSSWTSGSGTLSPVTPEPGCDGFDAHSGWPAKPEPREIELSEVFSSR